MNEQMGCRKIIHVDMDAFYASVEQREDPKLKGKPVVVGGMPDSRGVVCTCSYEARKFGIRSAMASSKAYRLCPRAIFLHPNMKLYASVSYQIREIMKEFTDIIEPLSLDEAFLDVTANKKNNPSGTLVAREILKKINRETRLTASAGVSYNKFLAKIASDMNKPNGLTVITPAESEAFIENLPIGKFFGIGKVTESRLKKMGFNTGADLKKLDRIQMYSLFGRGGDFFYDIVRGIDNRKVITDWVRKSYGREETYQTDLIEMEDIYIKLNEIASDLSDLLKEDKIQGKTITLKVKYNDFVTVTRSYTHSDFISQEREELFSRSKKLLEKTEAGNRKIRLLGISVSNFYQEEQLLFQPTFPFMSHGRDTIDRFES